MGQLLRYYVYHKDIGEKAADIQGVNKMDYYSIYLSSEKDKRSFVEITKRAGAQLAAVSECGGGYHISIQATPIQAMHINLDWQATA